MLMFLTQFLTCQGWPVLLAARHVRSLIMMAVMMIVSLAVSTGSVQASANDITGLRFGMVMSGDVQATRIVVETTQPASARILLLDNPYRLVIDVEQAGWAAANLPPGQTVDIGVAARYRFGHPQAGIGRLVIDTETAIVPVRQFSLPPKGGGHRLVIDFAPAADDDFRSVQAQLKSASFSRFPDGAGTGADTVRQAPVITAQKSKGVNVPLPAAPPKKWVVAIDAGHGGKDPGALGKAGTKEKDITLAAALSLASHLKKTGKVWPVLIRKDDTYYKLRQRIARAHDANADLFISLHADSAQNRKARGMSVFTLSDKASDKEAEYIARNENLSDLIGGPDLSAEDPQAADELLRMFQRQTMNESSRFAASILTQIRDMPGGDRRGHRFAGFAVLKSPDIPSVLVEMGFLSNREDERNLNRKSYRDKLVNRLSSAILAYLENSSG